MDAEDPFQLIKKGNAFEAAGDHWHSAEMYSHASTCLRSRADELSLQARLSGEADASIAEKRKVVSLFRAQSLEYMYKARHCLLEALRFENEQDRARTLEVARSGTGSLDPLFSLIDAEESQRRRLIFERLFSGSAEPLVEEDNVADVATQSDAPIESTAEQVVPKEETEGSGAPETANEHVASPQNESGGGSGEAVPPNADEIDDRQQSIESRLAQLDSSLLPKVPPPFISGSRTSGGGNDQNRLAEIQAGLGRLGVHLPADSKKSELIPENLSDDDQVKLIIQQAQDEVRFEQGNTGGKSEVNGIVDSALDDDDIIDENDSMFNGYEDDDLDIDALLSKAENLVAKTGIEGKGEGTEVLLIRKIQALLLEARLCLEISGDERIPNNSDQTEDGSEDSAEETDPNASESKIAARKKARELIEKAQESMQTLLTDWAE